MASNIKKKKFFTDVILRLAECTYIYILAHHEKKLDIPALYTLALNLFFSRKILSLFQNT